MLTQQKHLFNFDEDITYLNGAAYSPLLKSVTEAGNQSLQIKSNPQNIVPKDLFFDKVDILRSMISQLLNADDKDRIAIIPAVSYGMAIVAKNIHRWPRIKEKKEILLIADEFPNNVYTFERTCKELSLTLKTLPFPSLMENYNDEVISSISDDTALIVMPHIHWINGYKFDLKTISEKCQHHNVMLVIDGTQSLGIFPFDLQEIKVNALIGGSYKWMMGPYSHGFAYFDEFFDDGIPLEETWMNRIDSNDFAGLLACKREYRPKAQRYNVGEFSHFIQTPMVIAAVEQILKWGVSDLQKYCEHITSNSIEELQNKGCKIIDKNHRASHLFSVLLPSHISPQSLYEKLQKEKIFVSLRGDALRISPHVYNSEEDLGRLAQLVH